MQSFYLTFPEDQGLQTWPGRRLCWRAKDLPAGCQFHDAPASSLAIIIQEPDCDCSRREGFHLRAGLCQRNRGSFPGHSLQQVIRAYVWSRVSARMRAHACPPRPRKRVPWEIQRVTSNVIRTPGLGHLSLTWLTMLVFLGGCFLLLLLFYPGTV